MVLAIVSVIGVSGFARAAPPDPPHEGQIDVARGNHGGIFDAPSVNADAKSPGTPASSGAGVGDGGGAQRCEYLPSKNNDWTRRFWETQHPGQPVPSDLVVYQVICNDTFAGWVTNQAVPALPTPAQLAQQAAAQMRLSLPVPRHSPDLRLADGRPGVVVGAPTWVWTEPVSFRPLSRRVAAGPVWAQVTARPVVLEFDPGDGSAVVGCAGPGTPFDRSRHGVHEASPDCGFVYARSSLGRPADQVTATYAIRWQVSWVGATAAGPAQGVLPELVSQATSSFVVAEAQALRTQ